MNVKHKVHNKMLTRKFTQSPPSQSTEPTMTSTKTTTTITMRSKFVLIVSLTITVLLCLQSTNAAPTATKTSQAEVSSTSPLDSLIISIRYYCILTLKLCVPKHPLYNVVCFDESTISIAFPSHEHIVTLSSNYFTWNELNARNGTYLCK